MLGDQTLYFSPRRCAKGEPVSAGSWTLSQHDLAQCASRPSLIGLGSSSGRRLRITGVEDGSDFSG